MSRNQTNTCDLLEVWVSVHEGTDTHIHTHNFPQLPQFTWKLPITHANSGGALSDETSLTRFIIDITNVHLQGSKQEVIT